MEFLGLGKSDDKKISLHVDPFKKEKVKRIYLRYEAFWAKDPFTWSATVEFENGNTSGEYKTKKHEELQDCLKEIETMLKGL